VVDVEILPPEHEPRVHVAGARAPGWLGAGLAVMTVAAAFGVGFLAMFGRTLFAALVVRLVWPWIFSSDFTARVFGSEHIVFWKILVVFLVVDLIARVFIRRELWPKK